MRAKGRVLSGGGKAWRCAVDVLVKSAMRHFGDGAESKPIIEEHRQGVAEILSTAKNEG
jgi:hypothetical protein